MRGFTKACVVWAAMSVVVAPTRARADGYVNPWIGVTGVSSNDNGQPAFGVTTGYMGAGVFGFEADFGYSPNFFGVNDNVDRSSALTITGDAILGIPIGGTHGAGVRPFVSGGFGLMRTSTDRDDVSRRLTVEQWALLRLRRRHDGVLRAAHRSARRPAIFPHAGRCGSIVRLRFHSGEAALLACLRRCDVQIEPLPNKELRVLRDLRAIATSKRARLKSLGSCRVLCRCRAIEFPLVPPDTPA